MIMKEQAQDLGFNIIETDNILTNDKAELIEKIKSLIPNIINSDNVLDEKALQALLGATNITGNNQGYELTFAGKALAKAKASEPTTKELKVEHKQSKNFDETENVIIRGDNIDVLKILYQNYHNKIKMIYIDPPYNTESENFVYNDNFKESEADLVEKFGLRDETLDYLHSLYGTRTHSGWLSFMYPRLKLARELLTDDGVIFISIDDNEQANLKILCDEIFGEDNFVANFIHKNNSNKNQSKLVSISTEYIICFAKNKERVVENSIDWRILKKGGREVVKIFNKLQDKGLSLDEIENEIKFLYQRPKYSHLSRWNKVDENGIFKDENLSREGGSKNYTIINPNTGKECVIPPRGWGKSYKDLLDLQKNDLIWYGDENTPPGWKYYLGEDTVSVVDNFFYYDNSADTKWIKKVFGSLIFNYPKPLEMLKLLISLQTQKNNDLILDFFAGSGTTAHAVMQLNAEDGGNRKFILAQWDEKIDEKKSKAAYDFCQENDFDPIISSITIERVNRAGEKIKRELEEKKDMLSPDNPLDIGYKVFSLTDKPQITMNEDNGQIELFHPRTDTLNTLINMLCATCKPLDTKIEELIKDKLYKADNEYYILGHITQNEIEKYKDFKINIDAFSDIDLQIFLNLNIANRENITIID